jgi:predicted ester cyclase
MANRGSTMFGRLALTIAAVAMMLISACGSPASHSADANERTVRELFSAIDGGDIERVRSLTADDFALHILGLEEPLTTDGLVEAIDYFFGAFPDTQHVIEQTLAADDRVAVVISNQATSSGPYEGAEATGKRVIFDAIHILRLANGQVSEWWALEDNLSLMQQLGMELKPSE